MNAAALSTASVSTVLALSLTTNKRQDQQEHQDVEIGAAEEDENNYDDEYDDENGGEHDGEHEAEREESSDIHEVRRQQEEKRR